MNIYNLSKEFLEIFDELEENGGELTEELEKRLTVTQESFRTSVKNLSSVVKQLDYECDAIKVEQKRLKELYDRKQKVIERIKKILLYAINNFGDVRKNDVRYIAWETGECSIRKSKAVNINEDLLAQVTLIIQDTIKENKENNQLDVNDRIPLDDISMISSNIAAGNKCVTEDLNHMNVDLSLSVPMSELGNGNAYVLLKEIAKYTDDFKLAVGTSKTELKKDLEVNGSCAPNLAKLVINENIQIK